MDYNLQQWTTPAEKKQGNWNAGINRIIASEGTSVFMPSGVYTQHGEPFMFNHTSLTVTGNGPSTILKRADDGVVVMTNNKRSAGWDLMHPWILQKAEKGDDYLLLKNPVMGVSIGDAIFVQAGSNNLDPEYGEYNIVDSLEYGGLRVNLRYPLSRTYNIDIAPYSQKTASDFPVPEAGEVETVNILNLDGSAYRYNKNARPFVNIGDNTFQVVDVGQAPDYPATIKNTGFAESPGVIIPAGTKVVKCVCMYRCNGIPQGQRFSDFHIEDDFGIRGLDASHAINARFSGVSVSGAYSEGIEVGNHYPQVTDCGRDTIFDRCVFNSTTGVLIGHPISRSACDITYRNSVFNRVAAGAGEFAHNIDFDNNIFNHSFTVSRNVRHAFTFGASTKSIKFTNNTVITSGIEYCFDHGDVANYESSAGIDNKATHDVHSNTISGGDIGICSNGLRKSGRVSICGA